MPGPLLDVARGEAVAGRRADDLAAVFRALGDPARLRLVGLIVAAGGEACVCDLTAGVGLSQPTVSHHLATLVRAGVLTRDKRGVWAWYRTDPARLELAREALSSLAGPGAGPVRATSDSARRPGSCS